MRKLMVVAILGLFGVAFLGCNEKASTTIATTLTSLTTSEQTGQTSSTTQAGDVCEIDPFDPSCITQDNIVLSYADWGDQNLNAALIEAFEAKYPNIKSIPLPPGYHRIEVDSGSFGYWLRHLPLKTENNEVRQYNGELKYNQNLHTQTQH